MSAVAKEFSAIRVWHDEVPRTGAENMAVDQLLMERSQDLPVLRIYRWSEPTVSFGYFNALADARAAFPESEAEEITYVRRWTGGGVVDHRCDVTYTLAIPRSQKLANTRGAVSYQVIHQALADLLTDVGESVRLTSCCEGDGGVQCFTNPVAYDLTDLEGHKVAGAGQRRSKYGLLHQGSVIPRMTPDIFRDQLHQRLGAMLAQEERELNADSALLADAARLAEERYDTSAWLHKK